LVQDPSYPKVSQDFLVALYKESEMLASKPYYSLEVADDIE